MIVINTLIFNSQHSSSSHYQSDKANILIFHKTQNAGACIYGELCYGYSLAPRPELSLDLEDPAPAGCLQIPASERLDFHVATLSRLATSHPIALLQRIGVQSH